MTTAMNADRTTTGAARDHLRGGGVCLLGGVLLMVAGAIVFFSTGADLDEALAEGTLGAYLTDAAENHTALMTNLGLWVVGVTLIGLGGTTLARSPGSESAAGVAAQGLYVIGAATAVVSFFTWAGIVHAAGALDADGVAEAMAFSATYLDWFATILVIGLGPFALVAVARPAWAPQWLRAWAAVAAATSVLVVVAMVDGALHTYGTVIIPVGLGWSITAAVLAIRSA